MWVTTSETKLDLGGRAQVASLFHCFVLIYETLTYLSQKVTLLSNSETPHRVPHAV